MGRCRAWRPVPLGWPAADEHIGHRPGQCRVCWKPCRHQVPAGVLVCPECAGLLASHPDPAVRLEILRLAGNQLDTGTLGRLALDGDPAVAAAARQFAPAVPAGLEWGDD